MTDPESNISDAPGTSSPAPNPTTTPEPAPSSRKKRQPRRRPEKPEDIIEMLLSDVRCAGEKVLEWRLKAAASLAWARMNLPRKEWQRLFKEKRLGLGIRAAQMQCRIGGNVALRRNCFNLPNLPRSIAALYELSVLKPDTITSLCEDDLITRMMTPREVKALVQKALIDEAAGKIRPPTLSFP